MRKKYLQSHLLGKQMNGLPTTQLDVKEATAFILSTIELWDWLSFSANKQGIKLPW